MCDIYDNGFRLLRDSDNECYVIPIETLVFLSEININQIEIVVLIITTWSMNAIDLAIVQKND